MGRPSLLTDAQKAEAPATAGKGCDIERTCPQLRCKPEYNFTAYGVILKIFYVIAVTRLLNGGRPKVPDLAVLGRLPTSLPKFTHPIRYPD
jgi:hypothetical protein